MRDLVAGIAVAAAAGLMMGAAMKPQLDFDDRPAGPQILTAETAMRSAGPFDDGAGAAAYRGKVPDYVYGTDWNRPVAPIVYAPEPVAVAATGEARDAGPVVAYDEPVAEPVSIPSIDGGSAHPVG